MVTYSLGWNKSTALMYICLSRQSATNLLVLIVVSKHCLHFPAIFAIIPKAANTMQDIWTHANHQRSFWDDRFFVQSVRLNDEESKGHSKKKEEWEKSFKTKIHYFCITVSETWTINLWLRNVGMNLKCLISY